MTEKYLVEFHIDVAEEVASVWNVAVPFPTQQVLNKYNKWASYMREIEQLKRMAANPYCKHLKTTQKKIAAAVRKRDRLKVPPKYLSWAHIAAFVEALAKRDARLAS